MTRPYDLSLVYVFITVPGLLLALLGIVETIRHRNFYYLVTLPVLVFLSFGWHGPLGPVLYAIPILNRFRNPGMLFNPANFLLCLMAALGAKALFGAQPWLPLKKYLPWILAILLASAAILGLVWHLGTGVQGWYGMLAVLALFSLAVTAYLRGRIGPGIALGAVLALILFQLIRYNTNQKFNWSLNNPDTYATRERALGSTGLLEFLRSDPNQDFRTWTAAEFILSTNGWNIWRIPTISGWNPITLESYQNYIQEFIQCSDYTSPNVGGDHELESPMIDLLGTKYLISMGGEVSNSWAKSGKFRSVFTDSDWWRVFENKDYLSRAWFYPRAYTVPDKALTTALMKSSWFEARKTLLFDRADLPQGAEKLTEELSAIRLLPDQVEAASRGRAAVDKGCAQPQMYFRDWNGEGNWVRFRILTRTTRGAIPCFSNMPPPTRGWQARLNVDRNGDLRQSSPPLILPRTAQYNCASKRTAELGEFTLAPGSNIVTLTLRRKTPMDLYSLWLVRLPETAPAAPGTFAFRDSSYTANRISLTADIPEEGFVLLNEIYYPGWEATVDGHPMAICRVDGIFRGLRSLKRNPPDPASIPAPELSIGGRRFPGHSDSVFGVPCPCRRRDRKRGI